MIAEQLVSPATQSKVRELLAKGGDLVSIASRADEVILAAHNEGPLRGNQEAIEFNKKFPNSGMWHFVNLPLGTVSYEQASKFTSSDDRAIYLTQPTQDVVVSSVRGLSAHFD
jgi:hypothetical protein